MAQKSFMYFSYGSNMQSDRIHKNSPSAKQKGIGKIDDYRLDFIRYSDNWHGCSATIVPSRSSEVWGVIWEIDMKDMPNLDKQEGVDAGIYLVKNVTVQTLNGDDVECRTYQQTQLPDEYIQPNELPPERQPSLAYMNRIIEGAKEYQIPTYYLKFLNSFRHNNYKGPVNIP
ncbi:gamma-glutamylcyclotransferase-like isoform X2 [Phymastichus coffea]|nr:gamma-glutamylcyclotransferase-like isoform X2 [Phymastichus coffea]XP_058807606.1 gamma-glutamylcyclotransferase-like isoform X2 [Phymastichus coffea]